MYNNFYLVKNLGLRLYLQKYFTKFVSEFEISTTKNRFMETQIFYPKNIHKQ